MTRHIRPHKGGRTASAPSARIRPATLARIMAEKRARKTTWANMIEEQWGDTMKIQLPACETCGKKNCGEFYILAHDIALPACTLEHAQQAAQKRHDAHNDPCYWNAPAHTRR